MALQNKLGINNSAELARVEERISKIKAIELYESNIVEEFEVGKFSGLAKIHKFLFDEIYDFAGKARTVNIAKGNFRFVPVMYLETALKHIDAMPQSTYDEIIEKYEVDTIVLGMPLNLKGEETARAEITKKFFHKLKCKYPKLNIKIVDERLTTVQAHKTMNELKIKNIEKKNIVDILSAVYILETYMNKNK